MGSLFTVRIFPVGKFPRLEFETTDKKHRACRSAPRRCQYQTKSRTRFYLSGRVAKLRWESASASLASRRNGHGALL